jgi:hypothetical protein
MSNACSVTNAKDLQLNKEVTSFKSADWIGSLPIQSMTIDKDDDLEDKDSGTVDVCQYIRGGLLYNDIDPSITKLRFDSSVFPPSESHETAFKSSNPTYIKLRVELQRAAIQCGYKIVPKSGARFVCKCGRTYANATNCKSRATADVNTAKPDTTTIDSDKETGDPLMKQSLQSNDRNPRKRGPIPLRRNTSTSLPMDPDETCKFAIKLYHDDKGYYVCPKYGCAIHSNHQSIEATNNCYGRTSKVPISKKGTGTHVNVRSILKPLVDQLCDLYENENARHRDMPTIDGVVNVMNETIYNVNHFLNELDKKKKRRNNTKHESVQTKKSRAEANVLYHEMGKNHSIFPF